MRTTQPLPPHELLSLICFVHVSQALGWVMWSMVGDSLPSILMSLIMVGVGGNIFQTVNKAAVAQHAPSELVGTVMGLSGEWTELSTGPGHSVDDRATGL